LILVIAVLGGTGVHAQGHAVPASVVTNGVVTEPDTSSVRLIAGRSTLVDIGVPIARVSLTSAEVADALVTSSSQLLVHGKAPGTISMFVWDRAGAVRRYEVIVARDVAHLADEIHQLLPGEAIDVRSNGKDIVLSGTVSSKDVVERAVNLSAGFVDKKEEVVTLLQVQNITKTNQVLLKVRFAEVSRQALTELGLSLFTSPTGIQNTLGRVTTQQVADSPNFTDLAWTKADKSFGSDVTSASGKVTFSDFLNLFVLSEKYDLGVLIRALQTRGLFQSLAEPNLVAESGKEASFLAGGEFPIPIAQGTGGNVAISIVFKEYGIRLNFTPVVDGDRVHLKVRPEVSTLDFGNAIVMQGFRIPSLITRRTETELELRDGQTFAIAGLINNTMNSTMQKIPGIGDIPILGNLFKSKAAQKNRTELVVMITPHILLEGSSGVTRDLPRMGEPYLSPLPADKSIAPPPVAFPLSAPSGPAGAAAASPASVPATVRPTVPTSTVGNAAVEAPAPSATAGGTGSVQTAQPKPTPSERKALEQQQKQERARQQAEAKAKEASDKAAAEQAEKERRLREASEKKKAKQAREQAARDAAAAKRAAAATTTH
jgi:pilus assembly protein CpaC